MLEHEIIGAIYPWPGTQQSLPDGWSWGEDESVAKVRACKSRMILQADALAALRDPTPHERMLKYALYSGAAEWELRLLQHPATQPGLSAVAVSGISLAQLAGDAALVKQIWDVAVQKNLLPTESVATYEKWLEEQLPAFLERRSAMLDQYEPILNGDESRYETAHLDAETTYQNGGGDLDALALHAMALRKAGRPSEQFLFLRLLECIGHPTDSSVLYGFALLLWELEERRDIPPAIHAGIEWFRDDLNVQIMALALAEKSRAEVPLGVAKLRQAQRVSALIFAHPETKDVRYGAVLCAKTFADYGDFASANAVLSMSLDRHGDDSDLRAMQAAIQIMLARSSVVNERLVPSEQVMAEQHPVAQWIQRQQPPKDHPRILATAA